MSWRRYALCKDKFGLYTCWLTLFKVECSSLNDVKFASSVSWMTTDSQTEVLALKMLDIFHCCFSETGSWSKFLETQTSSWHALMSSPRFSEAIWVLNSDWLSNSILNGDWLYFHTWRMLYAKLIGRIALFTCENIAHIEFYRKIHYLTREFRVKLHAKTDIARIAKRWVRYRFSSAI